MTFDETKHNRAQDGKFTNKVHAEAEGISLRAARTPTAPKRHVDGYGVETWSLNGKTHRTDGPAIINPDGSEQWRQHGQLHREGGPAVTTADGRQKWYKNGEPHRTDGPATIDKDGNEFWYKNGQLHREGGPALTTTDGTTAWYNNGRRHRLDGPALERADGSTEWWQNDQKHREGGPAITEPDGYEAWYDHGRRHRLDGPAVTKADGTTQWWVEGRRRIPPKDGETTLQPIPAKTKEQAKALGWWGRNTDYLPDGAHELIGVLDDLSVEHETDPDFQKLEKAAMKFVQVQPKPTPRQLSLARGQIRRLTVPLSNKLLQYPPRDSE